MIDGLKPYPAYKDSGVAWLGEVPEHWEVRRLKWCTELNPSRTEARESLTANTTVTFLPMERVAADGRIDTRDQRAAFTVWNGFTYFRRRDVLVAKITPCFENGKGACLDALPTEIGFGSTEFHVLRAKSSSVLPQFLYRLTTISEFRRLGANTMTGAAGQQRVPQAFIANFQVGLPPLSEQAAIVRYLDYVDKKIRQYIRAKQKLIKLLEEQKQAIIHRAVTGQIDVRTGQPYPAYKPSGVEWLGDVPEHWESCGLKRVLSRSIRNGLFKKKDSFGSGVPLVNVADVYREDFRVAFEGLDRVQATPSEVQDFQVQLGDIFFVRSSLKLEGTGRSAVALECPQDTVFECHLVQARPNQQRVDPLFLVTQLNSFGLRHYLISRTNVVTMATIAQDVIATCPLWLPPLREQIDILRFIHKEMADLDKTTRANQRSIDLLREYRTRLIADVVTGKLDVREAAAKLPAIEDVPAPIDELEALDTTSDGVDEQLLDEVNGEAEGDDAD